MIFACHSALDAEGREKGSGVQKNRVLRTSGFAARPRMTGFQRSK